MILGKTITAIAGIFTGKTPSVMAMDQTVTEMATAAEPGEQNPKCHRRYADQWRAAATIGAPAEPAADPIQLGWQGGRHPTVNEYYFTLRTRPPKLGLKWEKQMNFASLNK